MYNEIASNKRRTGILIALFFVLIIGIGYAASLYSGTDPLPTIAIAALFAFGGAMFSYFAGDKVALATAGAEKITATSNQYVYRLVENLCITAGLQKTPDVYIIPDPAINAFATGRDPEHASIAITQGAIDKLENEELEGVIAHELSHIKNYDIRLMTVVIILVGSVVLVADLFRWGGFRGRRSNDSDSGGGNILMIVGIVLIILSPIFAQLIQLAISRRREYLADASGALLTRFPEGLARALEKIRDTNQPMVRRNSATAHLYLDSPFRTAGKKIGGLFATHPPVDERIKILRDMQNHA